MAAKKSFRDALHRLAQLGQATGLQLVRIMGLDEGNRYTAEAIEFDSDGDTQSAGAEQLTVINLAEAADDDGQLLADTNAVAVDVEGKWVILVQPAATPVFAGKVLYTFGNCLYRIRPQVPVGENTFVDKAGAQDINACNIAGAGPGRPARRGRRLDSARGSPDHRQRPADDQICLRPPRL